MHNKSFKMNPCGSSGDLLEASRFQILEKTHLRVWTDFPFFSNGKSTFEGCTRLYMRRRPREAAPSRNRAYTDSSFSKISSSTGLIQPSLAQTSLA